MPEILPIGTPKNVGEIVNWTYRGLLIAVICAGGWLANQVWHGQQEGQRATVQSISALQTTVNDIKLSNATADGTRFTSKDWDHQRENLDARFSEHEKRINAIETATQQITQSLGRIESKLSKP